MRHLQDSESFRQLVIQHKAKRFAKSYYNLATDLYEYGWGASFHFCRFAYGEGFYQAIARHEHYLAHMMGMREGMKVLDVGCGVGGPAREIAKFTGARITGLNNNDYQIERATRYAAKEGLSQQVNYVKGDFMVHTLPSPVRLPLLSNLTHISSLANVFSVRKLRRRLRHRSHRARALPRRRVLPNLPCP